MARPKKQTFTTSPAQMLSRDFGFYVIVAQGKGELLAVLQRTGYSGQPYTWFDDEHEDW